MSRTISVKEAAAALGITPRAVTYRLEKGQLRGSLSKNEFGVPEWRIYPNKEILAGLNSGNGPTVSEQLNFEPTDVVEAESIDTRVGEEAAEVSEPRFNNEFQAIVEQCVRPLVEEVKAQALALAEKERIIEEQKRQLRLLPDLQKRAEEERQQAEQERELRAFETEALNKQIAAIEEQKRELAEKASKAATIASDMEALKAKVEELDKPWWKKLFTSAVPKDEP